jgi:hypothetical protein
MQQRRIASYYPTLSGMPSAPPSMPSVPPKDDSADEGFICEEEERAREDEQRADEQLAAQAAEVRALRLATAGALVQQRAAELEALEARVASFKESGFGDKVQAARDHAAVAQAREELAKAKLKAMQLATEIVVCVR